MPFACDSNQIHTSLKNEPPSRMSSTVPAYREDVHSHKQHGRLHAAQRCLTALPITRFLHKGTHDVARLPFDYLLCLFVRFILHN